MSVPIDEFLTIQPSSPLSIRLEPALSIIYNLLLLSKCEHAVGMSDWTIHTALSLTPDERRLNDLVIIGLHYAVMPRQSWSSFPAYLNYLENANPLALRDQMLDTYLYRSFHVSEPPAEVNRDELTEALASLDGYLTFLRNRFGESNVEVPIETEAFRLVQDPPAMKEVIVSHLRAMWQKYLAPEWERNRLLLEQAVRSFDRTDFGKMSPVEAFQLITGQDTLEEHWMKRIETSRQIIFVPNSHIGPNPGSYHHDQQLWILYRPRLPRGTELGDSELSRAEIIVRLGALADDSRLRILRYIGEHDEARSQDIIQALDLSQSAASRHLMQLSATGYLSERRCEGGKCYSINQEQTREIMRGITAYLLKR